MCVPITAAVGFDVAVGDRLMLSLLCVCGQLLDGALTSCDSFVALVILSIYMFLQGKI